MIAIESEIKTTTSGLSSAHSMSLRTTNASPSWRLCETETGFDRGKFWARGRTAGGRAELQKINAVLRIGFHSRRRMIYCNCGCFIVALSRCPASWKPLTSAVITKASRLLHGRTAPSMAPKHLQCRSQRSIEARSQDEIQECLASLLLEARHSATRAKRARICPK